MLHTEGLLDCVQPEDVRLASPSLYRHITYMHIHEEPSFSIGVFILPPRCEIPLHDHPGMSVLSRVLSGSLEIFSCDWEDSAPAAMGNAARSGGMARVRCNEIVHGQCGTL